MKILVIATVLLLISSTLVFAALPTEVQLERYFIQVRLTVDKDVHNFYVKTIVNFDENGMTVRYGRHGEKRAFYPKKDIMNFDEAMEKYRRIR